ncbi:hypothetical protein MJO28_015452 [Puccinia striiformis f. sp. tritici]|uniref:Uncharacterized protein n=1 Tax=Puccinia striiformis f. sp. tritici TaxID=168172 RepID=A0ACC0DSU1_9BASI|nr:hypothetical protein MJO28_015452 [Puccinia striiformis f. sp. tritici]
MSINYGTSSITSSEASSCLTRDSGSSIGDICQVLDCDNKPSCSECDLCPTHCPGHDDAGAQSDTDSVNSY